MSLVVDKLPRVTARDLKVAVRTFPLGAVEQPIEQRHACSLKCGTTAATVSVASSNPKSCHLATLWQLAQ